MIAPLAAAVAAALACPATPVHGEPLPQSGTLSSLKWVQATPRRAGIVGILFGYDGRLVDPARPTFALWTRGVAPEGWHTKVLWNIRNRHAGNDVAIRGRRLDAPGRFAQRFHAVGTDGSARGSFYASIVELPAAGCWRLDVGSGGARGTLVLRAVDAPS